MPAYSMYFLLYIDYKRVLSIHLEAQMKKQYSIYFNPKTRKTLECYEKDQNEPQEYVSIQVFP